MTKKLETLFDLPEPEDTTEIKDYRDPDDMKKIVESIPPRNELQDLGTKADNELDDIAGKAAEAYDNLMDLGMNVESRYSSRIFEVANGLLKTALDAKSAKINKKLKILELELKREKLNNSERGDIINAEDHIVTDRNSLMDRLKNMNNAK